MRTHRVLGYGALLDPAWARDLCGPDHVRSVRVGRLRGWRRHWGILYRNGCWEDGLYVDGATGEPWDGGVAFLGVREAQGDGMPVREIEVDDVGLAAIDDEECLYRRIDARDRYETGTAAVEGPVWLYVDAPEDWPHARYEGSRVAVVRSYHDAVRRAAAGLVPGGAAAYAATTDPCPWPRRDLTYVRRR